MSIVVMLCGVTQRSDLCVECVNDTEQHSIPKCALLSMQRAFFCC